VHTLFEASEVKVFKKHNWGAGPVSMFFGTVHLTNENVEKWER
jgi:hypothetical protein